VPAAAREGRATAPTHDASQDGRGVVFSFFGPDRLLFPIRVVSCRARPCGWSKGKCRQPVRIFTGGVVGRGGIRVAMMMMPPSFFLLTLLASTTPLVFLLFVFRIFYFFSNNNNTTNPSSLFF
jgi:hypothetical protein